MAGCHAVTAGSAWQGVGEWKILHCAYRWGSRRGERTFFISLSAYQWTRPGQDYWTTGKQLVSVTKGTYATYWMYGAQWNTKTNKTIYSITLQQPFVWSQGLINVVLPTCHCNSCKNISWCFIGSSNIQPVQIALLSDCLFCQKHMWIQLDAMLTDKC